MLFQAISPFEVANLAYPPFGLAVRLRKVCLEYLLRYSSSIMFFI